MAGASVSVENQRKIVCADFCQGMSVSQAFQEEGSVWPIALHSL